MLGFYFDIRLRFQEGFCPDRLGLLALRSGIPQGFGLPQGFFTSGGFSLRARGGCGVLRGFGEARVVRELRGDWGER